MVLGTLAALLGAMAMGVAGQEAFLDHGVGAPAAESRGVVCLQDGNGRAITICCSCDQSPRGWVLVTDIDRGESRQLLYPEGVPNSPPFASLLSSNGRFYTFAGRVLLELDPTTREWLFSGIPAASEECYCGSAMCDGPDGRVYGGGYPNCKLVSFDPATHEMQDLGRLDPAEHYVMSLVADSTGWLYAGIGTARSNLVACDPRTREVRQLVDEADRKLGSGSVYLGQDGKAYGTCGGKWFRLFEGRAEAIPENQRAPAQPTGAIDWGRRSGTFPDGRKLRALNLPERYLEIESAQGAEVKRLTLDYQSEGATITSLAIGPGGLVYGSSAHPMHLFVRDPATGKLTDWGGVPRVGGGNFCAMATLGQYLFGAAYAGGFLYRYDSAKPWNGETGDDPNPKLVAQFEGDITRPRACLAHPDGRHVIMAGFMGYGMRGGGLGIYDNETGEATLLRHADVIPDQSTIALVALPNGDLVGGTSIETPGGGHVTATEGVLYLMDWASRQVVFRTVPVPGAAEVWSLEVGRDGMVYGLASGSRLFVFDPQKREVVHSTDLSQYGGLPRHLVLLNIESGRSPIPLGAMRLDLGERGGLYALMGKAVLRIRPRTFEVEKVADTPVGVGAGAAYAGGRLYFASGSHVWSYAVPQAHLSFGQEF